MWQFGKREYQSRTYGGQLTLGAPCIPVQAADDSDLSAALEAVRAHRLAFWDAMLWACAQRVGVRHLLTEDMQDGFVLQGVAFVNPFKRENDQLINKLLPLS